MLSHEGIRWGLAAHLGDAGPSEGHDHRYHVDRQLELQELGDAVIDVPPPHHRLHDAAEVVVGEDDVRGLLGHVCAGDTLRDTEEHPEDQDNPEAESRGFGPTIRS